jgi:hypothetical protein
MATGKNVPANSNVVNKGINPLADTPENPDIAALSREISTMQSQIFGNLVLDDAFLDDIRTASETLLNTVTIPVANSLTAMNRTQKNSIAVRRLAFVQDVKIFVDEHPEFAPRSFDYVYFNKLLNQLDVLQQTIANVDAIRRVLRNEK